MDIWRELAFSAVEPLSAREVNAPSGATADLSMLKLGTRRPGA
jgi:hypothetical protein